MRISGQQVNIIGRKSNKNDLYYLNEYQFIAPHPLLGSVGSMANITYELIRSTDNLPTIKELVNSRQLGYLVFDNLVKIYPAQFPQDYIQDLNSISASIVQTDIKVILPFPPATPEQMGLEGQQGGPGSNRILLDLPPPSGSQSGSAMGPPP